MIHSNFQSYGVFLRHQASTLLLKHEINQFICPRTVLFSKKKFLGAQKTFTQQEDGNNDKSKQVFNIHVFTQLKTSEEHTLASVKHCEQWQKEDDN